MNNVLSSAEWAQIAHIVAQLKSQICPTGACRYQVRGNGLVMIAGDIARRNEHLFQFEVMVRFDGATATRICAVMGVGKMVKTYVWDEGATMWKAI